MGTPKDLQRALEQQTTKAGQLKQLVLFLLPPNQQGHQPPAASQQRGKKAGGGGGGRKPAAAGGGGGGRKPAHAHFASRSTGGRQQEWEDPPVDSEASGGSAGGGSRCSGEGGGTARPGMCVLAWGGCGHRRPCERSGFLEGGCITLNVPPWCNSANAPALSCLPCRYGEELLMEDGQGKDVWGLSRSREQHLPEEEYELLRKVRCADRRDELWPI